MIMQLRTARLFVLAEPLFSRRYTGSTANPRAFAHTIADQIHEHALLYVTR